MEKKGWLSKLKESKRRSEEKKFEKLRIKFEQCKEGRTVTVLEASNKEAREKGRETKVEKSAQKSPQI